MPQEGQLTDLFLPRRGRFRTYWPIFIGWFIFLGWYYIGHAQRRLEKSKGELEQYEKLWKDRRSDSPDEKFREQEERNAKQLRSAIKTFSSRRTRILLGVFAYGHILFGVAAAIKTYVDKVGFADSTTNAILATGVGFFLLQSVYGGYLRGEKRLEKELEILKRKYDETIFCNCLEKSQALESSASSLLGEYQQKLGEARLIEKQNLDWMNWVKSGVIQFSMFFGLIFFIGGIMAIFCTIPTEQRFQFAIVFSAVFWVWFGAREMNDLKRASEKAALDIELVTRLLNSVSYHLAKSQNIETKIKSDNP